VTILRSTKNLLGRQKLLVSLTLVVLVLSVIAIIVIGRSGGPAQAAPTPVEVVVTPVKQENVPIYREWVATTDGMVNAEIKAQVTGYLLKQDYKEGSLVKKGQLLFEIDPRPFQAALDQANGELAQFQGQLEQALSNVTQAEAQLAQANSQLQQAQAQVSLAQANQVKTQLDVNKYAPLAEQKAVTQQDYDNAIQANKASAAQVDAAKAGVEAARSQLRVANAQIGTAKAAVATAKGQERPNARAASPRRGMDPKRVMSRHAVQLHLCLRECFFDLFGTLKTFAALQHVIRRLRSGGARFFCVGKEIRQAFRAVLRAFDRSMKNRLSHKSVAFYRGF
jgi:multidrug efflux pump subunit AcrA (membrane-fusion protein)